MRNYRLQILLLVFCSMTFGSYAQFTLSGEIRPRAEYRHGFRALAEEDQRTAFFIDQRSRLNLDYKSEKFIVKITLQDVRTWGSQSQLVTDDGELTTLHEAWGQVMLSDRFSLKMGRQEIILDDHRIFGNVGWLQQARSHDGAIVKYEDKGLKVDLGLAFNQNGPQSTTSFYSVPNSYKTLQYLWAHKNMEKFTGSFLFLNNGLQGGDPDDYKTYFSQTIGSRLGFKDSRFNSHLAFYYQTGKEPTNETKINATLASFDVRYMITDKTSALVGVELISGNDEVSPNGKNNAFNPFYGTNHKFNGLMDYFYVGNHANSVGLQDFLFQVKSKVAKVNATFDLHLFFSEGEVMDTQENVGMDKYLGTEVDVVFDYNFSKLINFKLGYSQMFGSETMEVLRGGDRDATSNWAWTMITIKPTFFTTAKDDGKH
ncbi:alginate export family protein [Fulvivirgaceae bacterium BMA12]|uniref:Alginate export family protein n=1 Tax=Agaribacillus aureus TaxID=3051825 RepID=A0ABT8L0L3_9BACT|nr:alginate export family protein [Fulvivirgaceae bacterium BMA12]